MQEWISELRFLPVRWFCSMYKADDFQNEYTQIFKPQYPFHVHQFISDWENETFAKPHYEIHWLWLNPCCCSPSVEYVVDHVVVVEEVKITKFRSQNMMSGSSKDGFLLPLIQNFSFCGVRGCY